MQATRLLTDRWVQAWSAATTPASTVLLNARSMRLLTVKPVHLDLAADLLWYVAVLGLQRSSTQHVGCLLD